MPDAPLRRVAAIVRQDMRLQRTDLTPLITMTVMPLLVMAFAQPLLRAGLTAERGTSVDGVPLNGAEQAVPGIAVMFAFFLTANVGYGIFREHGWNTWDRLRASPARPWEVLAGRTVTPLLVAVTQLGVLFAVGGPLYGLRVRGTYAALAAVAVALALFLVAFGFVLVAACRTVMQLNVFSNVAALLFAGVGGALAPVSQLPSWVAPFAPFTPSYWAMRGFHTVVLDGGDLAAVALPVLVLLGCAATLFTVGLLRFRFDEPKVAWS